MFFISDCIRLWRLADSLDFEPLRISVRDMIAEDLRGKLQVIHSRSDDDDFLSCSASDHVFEDLLNDTWAAYDDYPHALPLQQVFVEFAHAGRDALLRCPKYVQLLRRAPHGFTHALLMAAIEDNT